MATTVDSLRKAIGKKKQTMAFAWLADLMRSSGDLDGALQCVQTGLQAFPESIEGQLVLSKILVEKQDWDGVIQACEFVLLRNPYCLTALRRLGDAYAEKHDDGNRNYYYQLLHDLDPLDPFWREEYAPQIDIASAEDSVASAAALSAAEPSLEDLLKEAPPLDLDGSSVIEKAPETFTPAPVEEPSAEQNIPAEDDPFSNLSNLVSADEEKDNEVSFDDLEHSLDDAIAGFAPTDTSKDEFPTDEIEGSDISSALSGIFGAAETEEPAAPAVVEVPEEAPVQEEKAQSLSDAFDDIFGEDELPEEFVPTKPAASAVENTEEKPFAENPLTEQISAESIPVESSPAEDKAEELPSFDESGLFEKSPLADLELPKAEEKTAAEESLESSVGSSFDSLFGDSDDLPVENEKPAPAVDVPAAEENPVAEEKPAAEESLESSVENSFDSLFGDSDDLPVENEKPAPAVDAPAAEENPVAEEKPAAEESLESSVENSFDSLFGDSDDLPVENLNLKPKAEESGLFEKSSSADVELPKASEKTEDALESSVESSFDSLFGKDADSDLSLDDLKLDEKMENIFGKESEDALLADPTTSTRTLAEIYFGQGVYDEAIKIYKDLLRKTPDDASLKTRLAEIEKIRNDKTLN
ncbi:MAG: tetratricopeptide repeat protein [Fibrobacter sp.]|nr:tetratricopeptide repeat protein [Fibrobacter sp.]